MSSSFDALFSNQPADVPAAPAATPPGSSFDGLFAKPAAAVRTAPASAAPSPSETPAPTPAGTSFDSLFKPEQAAVGAAQSAPPSSTGSSFDSLFKKDANESMLSLSEEERKQSERPDPENQETEPWYSKTWDWLNRPLYDAHQWGQRTGAGTIERGIESGVEDLISGMTSPLSLALTVGTLGGDTLLDAGAAGLRSLGVSKEAAPFVARGIKSLMDLGFTGQQVVGLVTQSPKVLDALKDGDYETAARLGTNLAAAGAMAAAGATKTFEDAGVVKDAISGKTASQIETLKTAKKIAGVLDEANAVSGERAKALASSIRQDLRKANATDEITQGAIRKYIAASGDTKLLRNQHDALAGTLQVRQPTPEEVAGAEFKKWLGSSKMVDAEGKPIVAYHGTMVPEDIQEFESGPRFDEEGNERIPGSGSPNGYLGPHFAIGENAQKVASQFATGNGIEWLKGRKLLLGEDQRPKVYPVNLKIENPKDFGSETNLDNFINEGHVRSEEMLNLAMQSDGIENPEEGGEEVDKWLEQYEKDSAFRRKQNQFISETRPSDFGHEDATYIEEAKRDLADQARQRLLDAGFDGILYGNQVEGGRAVVPIKEPNEQIRFAIPNAPAVRSAFSKDYVYRALDPKLGPQIRNAGLKPGAFQESPEQAISESALPPSGKKEDLEVYAVPRAEAGSDRNIMPSHQVVVDQAKPTGQVVPLRPNVPTGATPLTLDNSRCQSEYTQEDKQKLLDIYKKAQNLTPEQIAIANRLREFYAGEFDRANQAGIIRQAVEGYHPQAWTKDRPGFFQNLFGASIEPENNSAFNQLRHQTDNGAFDTNVSAARHRAFETEFQGEMAGYKAKSNDLSFHAANYQNHLDRAIAARQFLEDLRASGARASDGRPLVALQGSSKVVGVESRNPALLVNPQTPTQLAISNDLVQAMMKRGELQDAIESGRIDRLPFDREIKGEDGEVTKVPAYAWNTEGFQTIDHPSMRAWQYIGKDTAGNDALLKANMRVHPEAAQYVRQVVGADPSVFRTNPYLRTLMAAQREVKGSLLSFSPFHAAQEGLRGMMMALGSIGNSKAMAPWMDFSPVHVESDPLLRLGVRNNLTFPDYKAEDMFSDGVATHSKLIGKIPVANKIQNFIQEFTFDKLIPGLKARSFKSAYYRFLDAMPEASSDEVAHAAATYVNDVFGGQHWRDLGVNTNMQDIMRTAALAPDWLTSEARMLYRAAGGMGKPAASIARGDMLKLTAGLYMTARVVNMLATGKSHPEAPFGVVVPGKNGEDEKVYSMRTLPTDLVHALSDPRGFLMGRVNPLTVRTAIEGYTGRNDLGQKVTASQEFGDAIQNFVPIGVQGLLKGSNADVTSADQLVKAGGATVYKYRTEAENLAQQKASDRTPVGVVDADELAKHQQTIRVEDALRNGEISRGTVRRLFPAREANSIIENSLLTPLQSRFVRLPLKDALDVWNLATPVERDQLHSLLWKKRLSYIQSHTPAQRAADPVWLKMQSVYADLRGR